MPDRLAAPARAPAGHAALSLALATLAMRWIDEATNLRGWGAPGQAEAVARCAAQLEAVLTEADGDAALAGDR